MKIVLSSRGSRGDVNPVIEVAALLKKRGHTVTLAVPEMFNNYCLAQGLQPYLYPEDSKEVMQNMGSGLGSLKGAFAFFSKSAQQQFEFMLEAAKDADALVTTVNEVAAPTIAEYFNIPHYRIGFAPILPGNQAPPFMPWQNMSVFFNRLGWKGLNRFSQLILNKFVNGKRKELGLEPAKDSRQYHSGNSHTLLAINDLLAPPCESWNGSYRYDYTGYCYGQIDGELDKDLQHFLDEAEPPVYIGFGSVHLKNPKAFTEIIEKASEKAGIRVIVGTGWTGLGLGHLNAHIYSVGDTHHGTLFPQLAGIVHHGGSGTTHTAARAGIPQFILPQLVDQYFWGNAIYKNGLGPKPVVPKKINIQKMTSVFLDFKNGIYASNAENFSTSLKKEDGVKFITQLIQQG